MAAFLLLEGYITHFRMERPNMEQAMRNHYGLGVAEVVRPEALQNLTPTGRPKCYLRKRNSGQALIRLKELQIDMARPIGATLKPYRSTWFSPDSPLLLRKAWRNRRPAPETNRP